MIVRKAGVWAVATALVLCATVPRPLLGQVPVLLVPGWFDTERDLVTLRTRFLSAGWPADRIAAITFEEPTGSNRDHALELHDAIEALSARANSEQVDIVAHSMGGLAARWYILTHPGHGVRRTVFLGSPHAGTQAAYLAWGGGRAEMMPGSPFLDSLNAAQPVPEGVEAMTIRTPVDSRIIPGQSATLPGVPNHEVCCPTHAGLVRNSNVFNLIREFLEAQR